MKVIQVELEDWQAEVFDSAARRRGVSTTDVITEILAQNAHKRVDEACRSAVEPDPLWTAPIEYRLAHLMGR